MVFKPLCLSVLGMALSLPAHALSPALQFVIPLEGDVQHEVVQYDCEGRDEPITVNYINAHPNFLAVVPIEDEPLVFVNVIAASGARYVAGQYEWWSQGNDATLTDERADEDAEPLTCHAALDIP